MRVNVFVVIMILIIMNFIIQVLGVEYLKLGIRKAVANIAKKREIAFGIVPIETN
jgi:hypothetical protein